MSNFNLRPSPFAASENVPDRLTPERSVLVVVDIQEKFRDLIHGMKQADIELDRKVLSNLAIVDPNAFTQIVKVAGLQAA